MTEKPSPGAAASGVPPPQKRKQFPLWRRKALALIEVLKDLTTAEKQDALRLIKIRVFPRRKRGRKETAQVTLARQLRQQGKTWPQICHIVRPDFHSLPGHERDVYRDRLKRAVAAKERRQKATKTAKQS